MIIKSHTSRGDLGSFPYLGKTLRTTRNDPVSWVDRDRLLWTFCWCGFEEVEVPQSAIRYGLTGSCNRGKNCTPSSAKAPANNDY